MTKCPWCGHVEGCPYLDHVGNLVTPGVECPDVCGKPATHTLVLPFGKAKFCGEHFGAAVALAEGGEA